MMFIFINLHVDFNTATGMSFGSIWGQNTRVDDQYLLFYI